MLRDLFVRLGLARPRPSGRRGARSARSAPPPVAPMAFDAPRAAPLVPDLPPVLPQSPAAEPLRAPADPGATRYGGETHRPRPRVVGVLVGIEGELRDRIFRLYDGENRLGRAPESEVVLDSDWISREHASLVHRDGSFTLAPRSQRNPTYLNDKAVDGSAALLDRDVVRLGRSHLRFRAVD